jgi:sugar/nucleoside kinase (ribokinase family)
LGVRSRWAARIGNDLFSRFLLEEAQREGIDTSLFQQFTMPCRSVSVSYSFAFDRGFISHTDPTPEGRPREEIVASQKPLWVVNAPFDGTSECLRFLNFIHESNGRIYTDCQYTTQRLSDPGLADTLSTIDIFAPNLSEAIQITGATTPETALEILAHYCPLVVIKCGADGVIARRGSEVWQIDALPTEAVDTTGAGDCFNAGFLAAYLRGEPVETCLRYGNICGGLSVTQRGGATAAPTLEHLMTILQ